MGTRLGSLATVCALVACAARGPAPMLVAELGKADALVAAGCYRCLQDALATYVRLSVLPNGPRDSKRRAFETAVLIAVRAKELGLPEAAPLQRARELAAQLPTVNPSGGPAPTTVDLPPSAYLDIIALLTGEVSGFPPDERERRSRDRASLRPRDGSTPPARAALTPALPTDAVAQYLALAADCDDAQARKTLKPEDLLARHNTPLMRFRVALCGLAPAQFAALPASDPRWLDTAFFSGRMEMTKYPVPDVGKAAEHFTTAHEAFPESTAMTMALATARNALTEYEPALALFDGVLGNDPTHRDALLGRVMSLSYLGRYYDAIATATRMIELGTYHMGDAYYWRAWNRYNVHDLPAAWADVEQARTLMVNTAVYTLAGFIAYARTELDTAIERFAEAFRLDRTNCEAVNAEGLVHVDKQQWPLAGSRFATSIGCFAAAAERARNDLKAAENATAAPAAKARRVATLHKQIETSEHRRAQAAFNAASSYARIGQKTDAASYIDIAAEHPLLKEKAAALKAMIDKLPD